MRVRVLLVAVVLLLVAAAAFAAGRLIPVYVSGTRVASAIVYEGVTYVPLRSVAEALDCQVDWLPYGGVAITPAPPVVLESTPAQPAWPMLQSPPAQSTPIAPSPQPKYVYQAPAPSATYTPPVATTPAKPYVAENGSYYGQTSEATGRPKDVYVSGYYRKDGTYVRGHYRSSPRR